MNTCQYCGKSFCAEHQYVVQDIDAVCTQKRCRAKHDDMARHTQYRERVRQRNNAGLCGIEECGPHPGFECSLCRGRFCEKHIRDRRYPFRDGRVIVERPASLCDWCWERRKLWRR